jgi:glycosyltransferase involved in cell wall biosynthesis
MRSLYLCYFGLREPLVQTQVLPYLRELALGGNEMLLLTFEPAMLEPDQVAFWREKLAADGIEWRALKYHKRPSLPATIWDILVGVWTICRINASRRLDILHARSHVPLAMAMLARPLTGAAVIFDLRGLIADEYVDAGVWRRSSIVYRVMKWLEMAGFRRADWLVVLTNSMRQWILDRRIRPLNRVSVIPCCIDQERFSSEEPAPTPPASEVESAFELVYAGSVTGLYLLDEMAAFFLTLACRQPGARLRILTSSSSEAAAARLRQAGLADRQFAIGSAPPDEIPEYLRKATVGLSFRLPTFSQIAASPTKIPEYLAAGIPVISNAGIGDTDMIIEGNRVGVIVRDLSDSGYHEAIEQLLTLMADPTLAARCRETAKRHFDLHTVGGLSYRNAYSSLRPKRQKYKIEI